MKKYLKVIFSIIILTFFVYLFKNINFVELVQVFDKINPFYFFLAFLFYSLTFLVFNLRNIYSFGWLLKPDFWFFSKVMFAGFFTNTVTPGAQIGGEPLRAYILSKKYKKPFPKVFGAVFADKIIHIITSLFFIVFSILYLITFIPMPLEIKLILQVFLFLLFLFFAIVPLFALRKTRSNIKNIFKRFKWIAWLNPFKNNVELRKKIGKHLGDFTKSFKKTIKNKKIFAAGIILSLLYWILNYFVSYFLFISLGYEVNFFFVVIAVSLGTFAGVFSPSPGGVGFIEGFMVFIYSLIGINFAVAIVVSLLSRTIFYFHSIIIGGLSLVNLKEYFE